jgi:hypothetical protein
MGDFRRKGEEVMAGAATHVQNNVRGLCASQVLDKCGSVFEQALRMTVLLERACCGTPIKERPDVLRVG